VKRVTAEVTLSEEAIQVRVDSVVFADDLYPRDAFDQETVNRYRQAIDRLPPIEITHESFLIDGYHRLIAHRIEQRETIAAKVEHLNREDVLREATARNARHGRQLGQEEKSKLGRLFYDGGRAIPEIAEVLSVTERAVMNWTQDQRQKEKDERDQHVWDLWLQCNTERDIESALNISQATAHRLIQKRKDSFLNQVPDSLQVFNLWNFHNNDDRYGLDYPGRIPGQIVENVLYYYTEPFDTVVDPMAGGGTTVDVCKVMARRFRAYDIHPVRDDIALHDITTGFPQECSGCDLVFMDPPYWKQKQGEYSGDGTNLANLPLMRFYDAMRGIIKSAHDVLKDGGYIAVIIGPTQEQGQIYDHARAIGTMLESWFTFANRIIVPYTTQQAKGYHVSDAKAGRYMLKLYRDLLIYRK